MLKISSKPIWFGLLPCFGMAMQVMAQVVPLDRTMLPIPEPKPPVYTELDA